MEIGGANRIDQLRSVDDLPHCFRPVFSSFRYFNPLQSECFDTAFLSDANMVVSSPTGSGKTAVLELSILRLLSQYVDMDGNYVHQPGQHKIVYIAPTKSLVQEKVRDWSSRFHHILGVNVKELTGDVNIVNGADIEAADIICATPEKFDSVTRKHSNQGGMRFFGEISLVLIDEVHLLSESRGSVLEAGVVSRVKIVSKIKEMGKFCIAVSGTTDSCTTNLQHQNLMLPIATVRFVAISATIPNTADIAEWLEVPQRGLRVYGEEVRAVQLRTIVKGYTPTKNEFMFDRRLNDHIFGIISEHSQGRPSLVFCSSRSGTYETARTLAAQSTQWSGGKAGGMYVRDMAHLERLRAAARSTSNKQLHHVLPLAIAIHHGGMDANDRALVESLFLKQDILVLCATATLALGVNLPARLVVLKGTSRYCSGNENPGEGRGYKEYDRTTCLQMIGRAGRPQFDTEGVAVIMTMKQNVPRYANLANGAEEVESQLAGCLPEHLNAEIVLRTIKDVSMAIEWLKSTFMYVRVKNNPSKFGMSDNVNQQALEKYLKERMVLTNVNKLSSYGMVKLDEYGFSIDPQETGRIMAHYYIRFETMIRICNAPLHSSIPDLLIIMGSAEEFCNIPVRRVEKKTLNAINCHKNDGVKYRVMDPNKPNKPKERVASTQEKVFILINEALSDNPTGNLESSMRQETANILKIGEQIAQAMARYFFHKMQLAGAANSLLLKKCMKLQIWDGSKREVKQLPHIGKLLSERLVNAGMGKLQALASADPRKIEVVTMKNYPFGSQVKQELRQRIPPEVMLDVQPIASYAGHGVIELQITLTRCSEESVSQQPRYAHLIAGTIHDDALVIREQIFIDKFPSPYQVKAMLCETSQKAPLEIVVSLIHENIVGMDITRKITVPSHRKGLFHRQGTNVEKRATTKTMNPNEQFLEDVPSTNGDVVTLKRQFELPSGPCGLSGFSEQQTNCPISALVEDTHRSRSFDGSATARVNSYHPQVSQESHLIHHKAESSDCHRETSLGKENLELKGREVKRKECKYEGSGIFNGNGYAPGRDLFCSTEQNSNFSTSMQETVKQKQNSSLNSPPSSIGGLIINMKSKQRKLSSVHLDPPKHKNKPIQDRRQGSVQSSEQLIGNIFQSFAYRGGHTSVHEAGGGFQRNKMTGYAHGFKNVALHSKDRPTFGSLSSQGGVALKALKDANLAQINATSIWGHRGQRIHKIGDIDEGKGTSENWTSLSSVHNKDQSAQLLIEPLEDATSRPNPRGYQQMNSPVEETQHRNCRSPCSVQDESCLDQVSQRDCTNPPDEAFNYNYNYNDDGDDDCHSQSSAKNKPMPSNGWLQSPRPKVNNGELDMSTLFSFL